jgi:hypothetical protein
MLIGAMPLAMMAQDDDLYFVPKKKKAQVEKVKDITPVVAPQPKAKSSYEVIDGDTTKLDVIDFTEGKGIYPADTLETEDFALTKNMVRFDDYDVSDNDAFWAGYRAGRDTWMWHSPWYYGRYGWYDPWYYGSWYSYSRWYSPYYYSWYDPWFYGWYDPWYGPYYSYYGYYGWPYYRYGYAYYGGGGNRHYYGRTGNAGTIDIKGSTGHRASYRNTVTTNGARMSSLRERASRMGGNRVYTSGNTQRSASGNFSGRRGGNNNSNYNYSSPTRSSNSSYSSGSFGGSRSSGSGSFGGSRSSGGGGGSRMGGRR